MSARNPSDSISDFMQSSAMNLTSKALAPLPRHPGRRRDKQQLSCKLCRQRKRRCDRRQPCSYCIVNFPQLPATSRTDLATQEHRLGPTCTYSDSTNASPPSREAPTASPTHLQWDRESSVTQNGTDCLPTPSTLASRSSPSPGGERLPLSDSGYAHSAHWTSVLNGFTSPEDQRSVSDLISEKNDESLSLDQSVLLFDGPRETTHQELLKSLPPRGEADNLAAFYFRAQEHRLAIIHSTEFLKRYNAFWDDPQTASISWLGLLYSIFCFATQVQSRQRNISGFQSSISSDWPSETLCKILKYRERVVQCLVQCRYSRGGPDVMETLVHYVLIENYLNRESNMSVWLLLGNVVQIAVRMGYHRDPSHSKSLTPYQSEMRQRTWAIIYSLDAGFATQIGLPSNIKHALADTLPPHNLQDHDFHACSTALPPSRPVEELTSSTVIIAKLQVAICMGIVSDLVCDPRPLCWEDLVMMNERLDNMYHALAGPCRYRSMSDSLFDHPSIISQRIGFYMHYQRARILVNWKFLSTSSSQDAAGTDARQIQDCWDTVIVAAIEILQLQHQRSEINAKVSDVFNSGGMVDSCFVNNGYFLAASISCFLLKHRGSRLPVENLLRVRALLQTSLDIWTRTDDLSTEARQVVAATMVVLGQPEVATETSTVASAPEPIASEGPDAVQMNQLPLSNFNAFFDELPSLMMATDADMEGFPPLPSVPAIDFWS